MENDQTASALEIPVPDRCPVCQIVWEEDICPRCRLTRGDVIGLLQRGCNVYEAARAAALAGDFRAARLHLAGVRECGIPVLAEHPAVLRLAALCAEPVSVTGTALSGPVSPESDSPTVPSWLVPLTVGGSAFGLAAFCVAMFALLLAVAAFVLALLAFLRH